MTAPVSAAAGGRGPSPALARLSLAAVALAYGQIVFGAIVRITGSGMGCGDHWPRCAGFWIPPLDRPDLIIEISHRIIAAGLSVAIVALLLLAWWRRAEPGVSGRGGVLRPVVLAAALVVAAALLGAVTVKMTLNPYIVVSHLVLAMTLLATLVVAAMRARTAAAAAPVSARTVRGSLAAAIVAFTLLVLGALTANVPGAAASCLGFPHCRIINGTGTPLVLHVTHRVVAFLFLFHMIGLLAGVQRRRESAAVVLAARLALAAVVAQLLVAAAMVEMRLPPLLQSLHQATGTLVWLAVFTLAALARQQARAFRPAAAEGGSGGSQGSPSAAGRPHSVAVIVARGADF
jgi:heme A synthase